MTRPLVSIVTPSYNQGRFLRATIESVLRQTYPNIEYFVMDGGSKDESVDILKSYGNTFFWVSEKDRGQTHAINKGFERAKGSIRAYLNSDDVLEAHAVEKAVAYFEKFHDVDLVYGQAHYIDEEGNVTGTYASDDFSFERLMHDCCICQPAAFWRTRLADRIGPFNESLHLTMDYEYWLRVARAGVKVHHIHDLFAYSRMYVGNKTMSGKMPIFREIFKICQEQGGYIDPYYYWSMWRHLCWERDEWFLKAFRYIPRGPEMACFLYRHLHQGQHRVRGWFRTSA